MSLITDKFFFDALRSDSSLCTLLDGRIFNPARATIDEEEDRVPYIIITLDSVQNDQGTKDDVESATDTATVSILCVGTNREQLATLTQAVRTRCKEYYWAHREDALSPYDWQFSAGPVQYDPMKPCVYQTLTYQCDTAAE